MLRRIALVLVISAAACDGQSSSVIVRHHVARDVSRPLASLAAPETETECKGCPRNALAPDDEEEEEQQQGNGSPAVAPRNAAGAAVEQTTHGTRPSLELVASFDGLGVGFDGPQGPTNVRNPSDNSLAVGPDHIVQTVNTRLAIFTKKGSRFDTTGRVLYGSVPNNTLFAGFGGTCELRNNGDVVVRYDQLANRWLVVMPIFRRAPSRADQPAEWRASDTARIAPVGVAAQPGAATRLFVPQRDTTTPGAGRGGRAGQPAPAADTGPYSMCYAVST